MVYTALLDSNASEHAARMVAMQTATDNADELLKELNLDYNKSRQAAITSELLDIVGGSANNWLQHNQYYTIWKRPVPLSGIQSHRIFYHGFVIQQATTRDAFALIT